VEHTPRTNLSTRESSFYFFNQRKKTDSTSLIKNSFNETNSRSLIDRMFGTMHAGSLRSGAMVLFQSAVGAGALSMP